MENENSIVIVDLKTKKRTAPNGTEYWMGRKIQQLLGYQDWRNFTNAIDKAKVACDGSGVESSNHFVETTEMVSIGSGAKVERENYYLTRYACYLIAMNADPAKTEVATAQRYFAVQTRRQEQTDALEDADKRILLRERVRNANRNLSGVARKSGVRDFGLFHDAGYKGLYGGLGLADIKRLKSIPENEELLDCSGRAELAANEFRITQTEQKLVRDRIEGQEESIDTHRTVGQEVRATIRKIGGKMPEDLPPEKSIKKLISERKKQKKLAVQPPLLPEADSD
jgi:DNA-damage-inducible protein D